MYVYILECRDNSFYTGIAKDLAKRMTDHGKRSKYTRAKGVKKLVYVEEIAEEQAKKREAAIKKFSRQEKELLLKEPINKIKKYRHIKVS